MHDRSAFMANAWRVSVLLLVAGGSTAAMLMLPPVLQDPAYHAFADRRSLLGTPQAVDVLSNLPFLIVGISGLRLCLHDQTTGARRSWVVFFAGVALVGIGSAYYHADPNDRTLVWDRLPMTAGFMAILVAVLSERFGRRIEEEVLATAVLAGVLSVLWWVVLGDLRPYGVVQLLPMTVIPAVVLLYPGRRSEDRLMLLALALYAIAKVFEHYDHALFAATGQAVSGHSLKHLAAAAGCTALLVMIVQRGATGEHGDLVGRLAGQDVRIPEARRSGGGRRERYLKISMNASHDTAESPVLSESFMTAMRARAGGSFPKAFR